MATTIASKSDLQLLKQELTAATKLDLQLLKQELTGLITGSVGELRQEIALIRKDMEILSTTMTVRLGSMLMLGLGLLFAALKLA